VSGERDGGALTPVSMEGLKAMVVDARVHGCATR
jgi:hypothetical protein